jgi:hypothetical protein
VQCVHVNTHLNMHAHIHSLTHSLNSGLNVKRGWQRVSSTYQSHFDEERHGGGEWMLVQKIKQTSMSYQRVSSVCVCVCVHGL